MASVPSEPGWHPDPMAPWQMRYWDGRVWTGHHSIGAPTRIRRYYRGPVAPPPAPSGAWYFVSIWLSGGLLASVPLFHAAARLHRPRLATAAGGVAAGTVLGFVVALLGDSNGSVSDVGTLILLATSVVATVLLIEPRKEVYGSAVNPAPSGNQNAIAAIEQQRARRREARELAERDPSMARELGIGRPGTNRGYDDGGLLDLNVATEEQLRFVCGLTEDEAAAVVAARVSLDRFGYVEDAVTFGSLSDESGAVVRERGIVIER